MMAPVHQVLGMVVFLAFMALSQKQETVRGCGLLLDQHFMIHSKRVLTTRGLSAASVEVKDGQIVSVVEEDEVSETKNGLLVLDYGNAVVMPGLVDIHVHLNEPGREEWEGFKTGTRAAAAGGLTTVIDMPLNSFPTTTSKEALQLKLLAAQEKLAVDVGFWGGLVPDNAGNITALIELLDGGVLGLKSFMCPSGINDFPMTTAQDIKAALPVLAGYGRPLLVHAEVPQIDANISIGDLSRKMYSTYLQSRPPSWERRAIKDLLNVARDTVSSGPAYGAHVHIVHLSDADDSVDIIRNAKEDGVHVSVETCPHYLAFSSEDIGEGDTRFKCAPPIRSADNREKLWRALKGGTISMLSSDHSPAPPALKLLDEGDFLNAWGGISSLQLSLPVTWTMAKERGISLEQISTWWTVNPANLANLQKKGSIEAGKDADFVVWDPESTFIVDENFNLFHKHKVTPYEGKALFGRVISTFVRGQKVYSEGHHSSQPCGVPILALEKKRC